MGEEFKTKIHYPAVKTQERIINPPKKKKKKNYDKERERVCVCVLTYSSVGNMDWMGDNNLFIVKNMG